MTRIWYCIGGQKKIPFCTDEKQRSTAPLNPVFHDDISGLIRLIGLVSELIVLNIFTQIPNVDMALKINIMTGVRQITLQWGDRPVCTPAG